MPQGSMRLMLYRRYWERIRDDYKRLGKGVAWKWSLRGPGDFDSMRWINIPGTLPEKMMLRSLVDRGITFYFSYYFGDMPFTKDTYERYRPDFLLPDYKLIIEIAGNYWHSRPGAYQRDYQRTLWYIASGYKVVTITDADVLQHPYDMLDLIPELRTSAPGRGGKPIIGYRPFNPAASLAAQRRKWPRVFVSTVRGLPHGLKKGSVFTAAGNRPSNYDTPYGPTFTSANLDQHLAAQYRKYGQDWLQYIHDLGAYFQDWRARNAYPDLWKYYNRWKDWWARFGA